MEIALALRRRFASAELFLVGVSLLPAANAGVRERLRKTLAAKKIEVLESAAANYENKLLSLQDGRQLQAEEVIFTTPVSAPAWLRESDLALDGGGFVRVNGCLQSESAAAVFAAGDCAASGAPKSGAAAVRQAPLLAANIAAFLRGLPLKQWTDRRRLYIINTADGGAVAGWGEWSASGRWVWRWKKYLDQKFMNRFPRPLRRFRARIKNTKPLNLRRLFANCNLQKRKPKTARDFFGWNELRRWKFKKCNAKLCDGIFSEKFFAIFAIEN